MISNIEQPVKKNHTVLIIVLALVALILLATTGYILSQKWLGKWQKYENSRYQFSLEYPTNWHLGEAPNNNDGREISSPNSQVSCNAYGFANALTNDSGSSQTLDEYVDWAKSTNASQYLSQSETKLDQNRAVYLESKDGNIYADAIYALGKESGIGLVCTYQSVDAKEKYHEIFEHMAESFKINLNLDGEDATETSSCHNLLNRLASPIKDQQTFSDTEYTEVTTTSRESWDKGRLPQKVVDLENENYTCSPLPVNIDNSGVEDSVSSQPAVEKVEWKCDLEYTDWQYLAENDPKLANLEDDNYDCQKEACLDEDDSESSVWLCTK